MRSRKRGEIKTSAKLERKRGRGEFFVVALPLLAAGGGGEVLCPQLKPGREKEKICPFVPAKRKEGDLQPGLCTGPEGGEKMEKSCPH